MNESARATLAVESVAEAYLASLKSHGVKRLFVNAGTDFAPLIEAWARHNERSKDVFPEPVVAAHENVAMGMAHGAYLMSGLPQAVMFHVNVGTANASCAAMNAFVERVPLLITAGRTPLFETGRIGSRNTRVSWGQEMYDQAGLVREVTKWQYELRDGIQVDVVIGRALAIASQTPRGPVYLTLPREVLAAAHEEEVISTAPREVVVSTDIHPDPAVVEQLADGLIKAKFPVINAMASGADKNTVALLVELCERFGIGYVEEQARYLNFPQSHPLHLGFSMSPVLASADVLLCLESDVPWIQAFGEPRTDAWVVQAGIDPLFSSYPIRTHRTDLAITTSIAPLLKALIARLTERADEISPERTVQLRAFAARQRSRHPTLATLLVKATDAPIDAAFLSAAIGAVLHPDCIVFNEYFASPATFGMSVPGSYYFLPAVGGLGWAVPASLGAKIERPEKTCIALVGDGTYFFSNPAACHHAAAKHDLPTLTVICNNARWNAVDATAKLVYPQGHLSGQAVSPFADLSPTAELHSYVIASGGYGASVSRREELLAALQKALKVVEVERRQAVLNVITA